MSKKNTYPSIYIGCPTNEIKSYCIDEWVAATQQLNYPISSITTALVDNSPNASFIMGLKAKYPHLTTAWVNPEGLSHYEYITKSQEVLRKKFLDSECEFLLSWECDIFPKNPNALNMLLSTKKAVVGFPYYIRKGIESQFMVQVTEGIPPFLTTHNLEAIDAITFTDGQLKKVYSVGMGFLLIHREVVKKIKFRVEKGIKAHADTWFAHDLAMLNIPLYCNTKNICYHYNSSWKKVG